MPTKRQVLDVLTREELAQLVAQHGVIVGGRARAQLADRLDEKGPGLAELLAGLSRDRLKEVCRALDLDDGGRDKATLLGRLVDAPQLPLALAATEPSPGPAAAGARRSSRPPASAPAGGAAVQNRLPMPEATAAGAGATTLAQLESHLWEAANILRGSPVDRTDWKSYILPLLFFKRVCDVWDEEHAAMLAEYGTDYPDEHRFQIPDGCHWNDVRGAANTRLPDYVDVRARCDQAVRGHDREPVHLRGGDDHPIAGVRVRTATSGAIAVISAVIGSVSIA